MQLLPRRTQDLVCFVWPDLQNELPHFPEPRPLSTINCSIIGDTTSPFGLFMGFCLTRRGRRCRGISRCALRRGTGSCGSVCKCRCLNFVFRSTQPAHTCHDIKAHARQRRLRHSLYIYNISGIRGQSPLCIREAIISFLRGTGDTKATRHSPQSFERLNRRCGACCTVGSCPHAIRRPQSSRWFRCLKRPRCNPRYGRWRVSCGA